MKRRQIGKRCDLHGRIVEKHSGRLVVDQAVVRIQSLCAQHEISGGKIRWIDGCENLVSSTILSPALSEKSSILSMLLYALGLKSKMK